jgi:hypothetical protein
MDKPAAGPALRADRAVLAGLAYWGVMFGVGFLLGTVRVLLVAPSLGETPAVSIELPVMLAVCWFMARTLVQRWRLTRQEALAAGVAAFALLMFAEVATAATLFGESPAQWLAGLVRFPASLGFGAQVIAAFIPLLLARR